MKDNYRVLCDVTEGYRIFDMPLMTSLAAEFEEFKVDKERMQAFNEQLKPELLDIDLKEAFTFKFEKENKKNKNTRTALPNLKQISALLHAHLNRIDLNEEA